MIQIRGNILTAACCSSRLKLPSERLVRGLEGFQSLAVKEIYSLCLYSKLSMRLRSSMANFTRAGSTGVSSNLVASK